MERSGWSRWLSPSWLPSGSFKDAHQPEGSIIGSWANFDTAALVLGDRGRDVFTEKDKTGAGTSIQRGPPTPGPIVTSLRNSKPR